MALGRISGPLLKSNLTRDGVDLAFETDLLYLDVTNGRIGVNTSAPGYDVEIVGTLKASVYRMDELNIGNGVITGNVVITDGYIKTLIGDWHIQAEPVTGKVIFDSNTKINGNLEVTGDITLGGTINIGNFNDDLVIFNGEIGSDFIPDLTDTYDIGTSLKRWDNGFYKKGYFGNLAIDTNVIQANTVNTGITLAPTGSGTVVISGTNALQIPSGTEANKAAFTPAVGQIRLNTTTSQFEGYANSNWTSLGGVRSVDNLTYITAELTPGASDDTIRFYTNGAIRGSIDSSGLALNAAETIKFFDQDDNAYVSVKSPDVVDSSYIIKLPSSQPVTRSILSNDGSGNTTWASPDSFGGNRVYVSPTTGSDANDGINAPVLTLKKGLQIASGLTHIPTVDPGTGFYNAKRLLEANREYIRAETIAWIDVTYPAPGFVYDKVKCSRDVGQIIDAVVYDSILGGNRRTVEAGQSYLPVALVMGAEKTQTLAAINFARDLAIRVVQNLSPLTSYQAGVSQIKYLTLPGTAAVATVTSKFNVVYGIINTGSSPTIVEPGFKIIPVTVYVSSGDFYINNPVIIPDNVSVVGDSLRSVVIRPLNANKDMFRVRNGAYMTGLTFRDGINASLVPTYTWAWAVAFDDPSDTSTDRIGYTYLANTKPLITLSPYIQNCSIISFLGANGVWVDGSKVITPNTPTNAIEAENPINLTNGVPEQGKSMVGNAFTMLSFGGTGWLITNDAYAQLVSCFQIFMLNGTYTQSGGYISITNSATNFGLYALRSSGYSPNSFTFDRGYIVASGSSGGSVTLTSIGTKREPVNQYVLRIRDAVSDIDITSSFKHATITKSFNAATAINESTNIITISSHGFNNGDAAYYSNGGNPDVLGLLNNELYYISVLSSSTFKLYHDNSLSYPVDILAVGIGTHQLLLNSEEFYVGKTVSTHSAYQELTLTPGVYSFVAGQQILGLTSSVQNTAYAYSYNPATYKLIVSNEYSVIAGNLQRVLFDNTSTITSIGGSGVSIAVTAAASIVNTYFTSTFAVTSTISGNQLLTPSNTILQKINFHRPSIVNSSAHTWEFAGAGTDYNALPQNGGVGKGSAFEQYSELPGRVYTSGTNELGDFKVGDFIIAENKTGNIVFKTQVTIGELSILKLSLSSVEVTEFSTDTGLGDNESGGPSNSRISVQKAVRSFIANRLGKVLDKEVSTNSVPGSLVQLNASGQINQDLLPPSRGVTTYSVSGWGSRVTLSEQIPSISVIAGDNSSETYVQRTLDLNASITVTQGDTITQVGNTGSGLAKETGTFASIALVNTTGTFDLTSDLKKNGITQTGIHPTISYSTVNIVDNYYLKTDNTSQFLILYPGVTYDFTGVTIVTGANSSAQGQITSGPIYGVAYSTDATTLVQGSLYTPASGSVIYRNVPLTNVSGSGAGAKADITVTNGKVVAVAITVGGSGYVTGNVVSANAANIGGTGSGFSISILRADTRLYVNLLGTYVKFVASQATPEYIEDANATSTSIADLTVFLQKNFDARDVTSGGNVDYALSTITIASHTYSDGDAVIYNTGGNPVIGNMINAKTYWVKVINSNTIELYTNYAFTSGSKVIFGSSSTGVHNVKRYAVNTNSNTIYAAAHGLTIGQSIRFTAGDPPGGLISNNYYFVGSVTTNSFTLHTVKTDALASYNGITAGAVTISSTGTGSATITKQNVQVIGTTNTSSAVYDNWGAIAQSTIDAINIVSGTVNTSRLGSTGTANNTTFLRGDSSWQYAVQNIRPNTNSPLTMVGSYYTVGSTNYYYNSLVLDINRASDTLGDVTYTNLGVAGFNKSQFTVTTGNVTVKTGVIDAGLLGGNAASYYTNPANIVGQVGISKGGTGLSSVTKGDLLYSGSTNSLTQLSIGPLNSILTSDGLVPYWSSSLSLNAAVVSANSTTDAFRITQTGTGNALVVEDSANPDSTRFVIDNAGVVTTANNIIVDTTTDATGIQVSGTFAGQSSYVGVLADSGGYGRMEFGGSSGAYLDFKTPIADDYDLRIIVDSTSNKIITVGDLTINNLTNGGTIISNSSTATALRITQTGTGNALVVEDSANPDSTPFIIDANGVVSVGATPSGSYKFEVAGTSYFSSNVTVNGNAGIGANPSGSYKLEVTGTSYFSSNVTVNGDLIVNGTTTTVNSSTLTIDDKNIELGSVPSATVSTTGTVGSITGTGPWTATITGMSSTTGLIIGSTIAATAGTGTLYGGSPTSCVVASIVSSTSVTYTVTGGTIPTAGTITTITTTGATDTTADGGGITLKGTTDKTITYNNSTGSWQSNIPISITGTLTINGNVARGSATVTTTSTTQTALSSFAAATYGSGKYLIQATQGTARHMTEILVLHDGTTASATEYGMVYTGSKLYNVDVDISGGNVRILITTIATTSTVYKASFTLIGA